MASSSLQISLCILGLITFTLICSSLLICLNNKIGKLTNSCQLQIISGSVLPRRIVFKDRRRKILEFIFQGQTNLSTSQNVRENDVSALNFALISSFRRSSMTLCKRLLYKESDKKKNLKLDLGNFTIMSGLHIVIHSEIFPSLLQFSFHKQNILAC